MRTTIIAACIVVGCMSSAAFAQARDQIRIVGSSTVFPFSIAVAEEFGKNPLFRSPIVEPTGSGSGIELFCNGIGIDHPDIANASRRIKQSEVDRCMRNGVEDIVEVKIGFDGIVFGNVKSGADFKLSLRLIYLALAAEVPAPGTDGGLDNLIANPYKKWNDIDPALPDFKIVVLGPPPTSGTRDAFNELALEAGCDLFAGNAAVKDIDKGRHQQICQTVREDGAYVEAGENDNLIVRKLEADPRALGVFGFSFLDQNTDRIKGSIVAPDGDRYVEPSFENIADGSYPISRSMFFYVKKAHIGVIPGIQEYMAEFVSDRAAGDFGYLADKGLIPLIGEERDRNSRVVDTLELLNMQTGG